MKSFYVRDSIQAAGGLFICAFGTHLSIQANVGLAPWDAFSIGIAGLLGCSYGTVVVVTGLALLLLAVVLKEKIGIATLLDVAIVGKAVDFYQWLGAVPMQQDPLTGVAMLSVGQLILGVGVLVYMSASVGCGPRDALMVALGKRLTGISIGAVRSAIEAVVLLIGWLLGAKVGVGTLIAVFGIGLSLQVVFAAARFDAGRVEHRGFSDMWKEKWN